MFYSNTMKVFRNQAILLMMILFLFFFCRQNALAETLADCFALQAIPTDDPLVIPPTDEDIQVCFNRAVLSTGDVLDCQWAPSPDVCVISMADEQEHYFGSHQAVQAPAHAASRWAGREPDGEEGDGLSLYG